MASGSERHQSRARLLRAAVGFAVVSQTEPELRCSTADSTPGAAGRRRHEH